MRTKGVTTWGVNPLANHGMCIYPQGSAHAMVGYTLARNKKNAPPLPPGGAVAPPRQLGQKNNFWPIELQRNHLSEGALLRAMRVMEAAVCQDAEDDASGWSSDNSVDPNHPGAQRDNVGQLWDEHRKFLAALPAYLEYGGGRSRTFNCPYSKGMIE